MQPYLKKRNIGRKILSTLSGKQIYKFNMFYGSLSMISGNALNISHSKNNHRKSMVNKDIDLMADIFYKLFGIEFI